MSPLLTTLIAVITELAPVIKDLISGAITHDQARQKAQAALAGAVQALTALESELAANDAAADAALKGDGK